MIGRVKGCVVSSVVDALSQQTITDASAKPQITALPTTHNRLQQTGNRQATGSNAKQATARNRQLATSNSFQAAVVHNRQSEHNYQACTTSNDTHTCAHGMTQIADCAWHSTHCTLRTHTHTHAQIYTLTYTFTYTRWFPLCYCLQCYA